MFVFLLSDDPGAVHSCSPAEPSPPAGRIRMQWPGLPCSWHLWLEEEVLVLFHPPPSRHHDRQPGADHLDPQSHELHSGRRHLCVWAVSVRVLYEFVFT